VSETAPQPGPLDELRAALAEGDAERPSDALSASVLAAALEARAPGRSSTDGPPITPFEAFEVAAASLDAVLASLSDAEWRTPALRGLDVQGLVGHLIGVELAFANALDDPEGPQGGADHVASTDPLALAQGRRPPAETRRDWQAALELTRSRLGGHAPTSSEVVPFHGIRLPLGVLMVVRTFELWTHEEDIRRAVGRPLDPPGAASLRLMTDVACGLLPGVLSRSVPVGAPTTRLVLTGPGGRTWMSAGGPGADPVATRIVMDAVHFCRLVANRVDPAAVEAEVRGDRSGAETLFAVAAGLALD